MRAEIDNVNITAAGLRQLEAQELQAKAQQEAQEGHQAEQATRAPRQKKVKLVAEPIVNPLPPEGEE